MTCPSIQDLHRFHDGELSPVEADRVAQHLGTCDACAQAIPALRLIGDEVRAAPLPVATPLMMQRWKQTRAMQDRSVRRLAGWMTAAATIALGASVYVASSTRAHAVPPPSDWEVAVIGIDVDDASVHQATAQWIVTDLARDGSTP